MKRSKPLRRTPLQRSGPPSRSKGLKPRSAKTEATYVRRRALVADLLDNSTGDNWCRVILLIQQVDPNHRCGLHLADGHEIKTRGRGGSITDPDNVIGVCRPCHEWIGAHPIEAQELGLTKWSYEQ